MAEALLRVEQASHAQAQILRLHQELLGKIAVCESPVVLSVRKGIGNGEQIGFCRAVRGKGCRGNTGNVNRAASAQHSVQYISFSAENAAGLQINGDGSAGELLYLLLKCGSRLTNNGVQRIYFRVNQGDSGIVRGICIYLTGSGLGAFLSGSLRIFSLLSGLCVRACLLSGGSRGFGGSRSGLRLLESAAGQGAYHGGTKSSA